MYMYFALEVHEIYFTFYVMYCSGCKWGCSY